MDRRRRFFFFFFLPLSLDGWMDGCSSSGECFVGCCPLIGGENLPPLLLPLFWQQNNNNNTCNNVIISAVSVAWLDGTLETSTRALQTHSTAVASSSNCDEIAGPEGGSAAAGGGSGEERYLQSNWIKLWRIICFPNDLLSPK